MERKDRNFGKQFKEYREKNWKLNNWRPLSFYPSHLPPYPTTNGLIEI